MRSIARLAAACIAVCATLAAGNSELALEVAGLSTSLRSNAPESAQKNESVSFLNEEAAGPARPRGFISVHGTHFVDEDCNDYRVAGFNAWNLMEMRMGNLNRKWVLPGQDPLTVSPQAAINFTLDTARDAGLNVVRMFGHGGDGYFGTLQWEPGKYNPAAWAALDGLIADAAERGMRVILTLGDNWGPLDGKARYAEWCNLSDASLFFSDPCARRLYAAHVTAVLTRVNVARGVAYKDDPAILAWQLMNEPRCALPGAPLSRCERDLQDWVATMAAHVKSIDSNHLLTVGAEAFYSKASCASWANPGDWADTASGQNAAPNHALVDIDFLSFHLWPDNWNRGDLAFALSWIDQHVADAEALGKPALLGEFGKAVPFSAGAVREAGAEFRERHPFFRAVYRRVEASVASGGPLRGSLFWRLALQALDVRPLWPACKEHRRRALARLEEHGAWLQEAPTTEDVYHNDSTLRTIVTPHAAYLHRQGGAVAGCGLAERREPLLQPADVTMPYPDELSEACHAQYGRLQGSILSEDAVPDAEACCAACARAPLCDAWSFKACGGGFDDAGANTCELKALWYPTMPVLDFGLSAQSHKLWLSGVRRMPRPETDPYACQPGAGVCADNWQRCGALGRSLSCARPEVCGVTRQAKLWYREGGDIRGTILTLDQNSWIAEWRDKISTAAACCEACLQHASGMCNAWQFNHSPNAHGGGCEGAVAALAEDGQPPPFGPHGGCEGEQYRGYTCQLFSLFEDALSAPPAFEPGPEGFNAFALLPRP